MLRVVFVKKLWVVFIMELWVLPNASIKKKQLKINRSEVAIWVIKWQFLKQHYFNVKVSQKLHEKDRRDKLKLELMTKDKRL